MGNFAIAGQDMVDDQIRGNKVTDPTLLGAFLSIPRKDFVPTGKEMVAYLDEETCLGGGGFRTEPMVLSRSPQGADIDRSNIVLNIGYCKECYTGLILSFSKIRRFQF
tara:strand:- start:172 stop:495 length:324 start_codon:yes stop_codon:yes gene_type:complete